MVLVGRDRARAAAELARVAPPATAEDEARARAASLRLEPAGAAEAIVAALADAEPAPAGGSAR
jgi:hypothetical protein